MCVVGRPHTGRGHARAVGTYLIEGAAMFRLPAGEEIRRPVPPPAQLSCMTSRRSEGGRYRGGRNCSMQRARAVEKKLRPGFLRARDAEEAMTPRTAQAIWMAEGLLQVGARAIIAKLAGKQCLPAGRPAGRTLQACVQGGVDIRIDCPATQMIVDDGAAARRHRQGRQAAASGARLGVLVNAGGFAQNQRMRDRYQPGTSAEWSQTPPCDTGEMIEEMMRHGAAVAQMEEMVGFQTTHAPGWKDMYVQPPAQGLTASPMRSWSTRAGSATWKCAALTWPIARRCWSGTRPSPPCRAGRLRCRRTATHHGGHHAREQKAPELVEEGYLRLGRHGRGARDAHQGRLTTLKATIDRFNGFVAVSRCGFRARRSPTTAAGPHPPAVQTLA